MNFGVVVKGTKNELLLHKKHMHTLLCVVGFIDKIVTVKMSWQSSATNGTIKIAPR